MVTQTHAENVAPSVPFKIAANSRKNQTPSAVHMVRGTVFYREKHGKHLVPSTYITHENILRATLGRHNTVIKGRKTIENRESRIMRQQRDPRQPHTAWIDYSSVSPKVHNSFMHTFNSAIFIARVTISLTCLLSRPCYYGEPLFSSSFSPLFPGCCFHTRNALDGPPDGEKCLNTPGYSENRPGTTWKGVYARFSSTFRML